MNADIKKSYAGGFATVGNAVLRSGMSPKAIGMLCIMLNLPKDWHFSVEGLAKIMDVGKEYVRKGLAELKEKGFLQIEQVRENGKIIGTLWIISDTPMIPQSKNQTVEKKTAKSQSAKPKSGNPYTENPPQLNTYKPNTNKLNNTPYIPQRGNEVSEKPDVQKRTSRKQQRQEKRAEDMQAVQGLFCLYSNGEKETVQRLNEWLELRNTKRVACTVASVRRSLEQLDNAAKQSGLDVNSYLDQVIMRGWSGFFPLPVKQSQHQTAGLPVWQIKQPEGEGYFNNSKTPNRMTKRTKPLVFAGEGC